MYRTTRTPNPSQVHSHIASHSYMQNIHHFLAISFSKLPSPPPPHLSLSLAGSPFLNSLLLHLTTPAFIIPQLLNLSGSILFALSLGSADLSIAVPLANGVSLFSNAIVDHFVGEGAPLWPGIPGIVLILTGVTLCSSAGGGVEPPST